MAASSSRRWLALIAMVPAALVVGIDSTVLALALPTLATKLHASTSQLQWFVSAYMLVFAAAMIPAGLLADRYGRKRILLLALVVLGVGSLACAYSTTSGQFMAARVLQALGAAMVVPGAMGALPALFSEEERPKAVATIMAATMIGQPIGPLLGGWLLTHFWWGSVFIINVPVVLDRDRRRGRLRAGVAQRAPAPVRLARHRSLQRRPRTARVRRDPGGRDRLGPCRRTRPAGRRRRPPRRVRLWEMRVHDPLVDLRLFRSPGFTWGTVLTTLVSFSMMGVMFAMPLYFQEVLGMSAFGNGLRQLPLIAGLLIGAVAATRIAAKLGAKLAVALGFAILAAALVLGALTRSGDGGVYAMSWLAVAGLGLGVCLPTAMDAALGALSPEHGGVGSGLIQALRMVGGAFGAAILGSVINSGYRGQLQLGGLPAQAAAAVRTAWPPASRWRSSSATPTCSPWSATRSCTAWASAFLVCAGAAVAGMVLALVFLPRREQATEGAGADARAPGATHGPTAPQRRPSRSPPIRLSPGAGSEEIESGHEGAFAVE